MIEQTFKDIYDEELAKDAIINDRMEGFREDYLTLHCLLRKYKPETFMEIGTNEGYGTMIIANALGKDATVFSMDLPNEESNKSKQHPISEGKGSCIGHKCTLPYFQIFSDSLKFDYSHVPCEGYYIDGEHTKDHVFYETIQIVMQSPKLIAWHDTDMPEVYEGIVNAMENEPYDLFRVKDTRVSYAIKKDV